jgi:hypothetical protein
MEKSSKGEGDEEDLEGVRGEIKEGIGGETGIGVGERGCAAIGQGG